MPGLKIAQMNEMRVASVEADGYMLENEDGNIFLEKPLTKHPLNEGDEVSAFLYFDQTKTVVATTYQPFVTAYHAAFVDVVEQKLGLGVFVDIGLKKDMLLSKDDLPHLKEEWPQKGDRVFCQLKAGRNQMTAKIPSRFQLSRTLEPEGELEIGSSVEAYVFHLGPEGLVLFTETGFEIYVYYKNTRKTYRMGEKTTVKITHQSTRAKYNGILSEQKELSLEKDAETIYSYLQEHGLVDLGDKSSPDMIFHTFHMSKAAFKRALGTLYKAKLVKLSSHQTTLNKEK